MLVKIVKNNKVWNWETYDNLNIPIYGKNFNTKRETKKNWKQFAKNNNIKKWHYENLFNKIRGLIWNRVR